MLNWDQQILLIYSWRHEEGQFEAIIARWGDDVDDIVDKDIRNVYREKLFIMSASLSSNIIDRQRCQPKWNLALSAQKIEIWWKK